MPLVAVIVIRFVQFAALAGFVIGISNIPSLVEYLRQMAEGGPWQTGEFYRRTLIVTAPVVIGGLGFVGLEAMLRQGRILAARERRFPNEPWLWRSDWAEKRMRLSNRTSIIVTGVILAIYLLVMVPAGLWMASIKNATGVYWFLGAAGFILFGFVRLMWANRRWNRSELSISTLPGVIGGPFAGIVTISESFPDGTPFRVTLRCMAQTHTSDSKGTSRSTDNVVWQAQKVLNRSIAADRPNATALPVYFAIPYASEATGSDDLPRNRLFGRRSARRTIRWEVTVAPKDEIDPRRVTFEVPVYRTAQSSPNYQEDASVDQHLLEPVDVETLLSRMAYRREASVAGERHTFSLLKIGDFLGILAFTIAVAIGTWAIFRYVDIPASLFAALIPGAFAIMGTIALIEMLTWQATITVGPEGVRIVAGYTGLRRTFDYPPGSSIPVSCAEQYKREAGSVWCVRLTPSDGKPCLLVKRLDGKQEASAIRDWLMSQFKKLKGDV